MIDFNGPHISIFICGEDDRKIIISSSDAHAAYKKCLKTYGFVDLSKSYLLQTSKRNTLDRRKEILDAIPSKYRIGKSFAFNEEALSYILEICSAKDWNLHQGIKFLNSEQIKEKNERNARRRLLRTLKILKYVNSHENFFKISFEKVTGKANRYIRLKLSFINGYHVPESKFDFNIQPYLKIDVEKKGGGVRKSLLYNGIQHLEGEILSVLLSEENPLVKLEGGEENEELLREISREYDEIISKAEIDFDADEWLNPKFEWSGLQDKTKAFGNFLVTDVSKRRDSKINIMLKDVYEIIDDGNRWNIWLNSGNKFVIEQLSESEIEELFYCEESIYSLTDSEQLSKFYKFLEELFYKKERYHQDGSIRELIYIPRYTLVETIYLK